LMQAINLLLSDTDQIVYVLGLDREKIAAGLAAKFHELLPFLNEKRDGSKEISGLDFGYSYLEKFIQIPFQVPRPAIQDIAHLLSTLNKDQVGPRNPGATDVSLGVLFETQADSPLVRTIVMAMAPALEFNPRRIKQFINQFRLSAIIASQTGLFGSPRKPEYRTFTPEILGKLLTITLRWPLLIVDAHSNPGLLDELEAAAVARQKPNEKASDAGPESELARYWLGKPALCDLLLVGLDLLLGKVSASQSLEGLDLERYLQVAPAIQSRAKASRGGPSPSPLPTSHEEYNVSPKADDERSSALA